MLGLKTTSLATALLQTLFRRLGERSAEVQLLDVTSVDWQSLTLEGERHVARFAFCDPRLGDLFCAGIEDAEFDLPRGFVADIKVVGREPIGTDLVVTIEALTLLD